MANKISLQIENRTLIIKDETNDGLLKVVNILSEEYMDNLSDSSCDPLIEFANDFQEIINNNDLLLTIKGYNNTITFDDDHFPYLNGEVCLTRVELNNPDLKNCSLFDVILKDSEKVKIHYSWIDELFIESTSAVELLHCFINDENGLDFKRDLPYKFLMNKHQK